METSIKPPKIYRFGVFELDTLARQLRRQGVRIRLQDQPFQVLTLLLERAGQIVTREELQRKLWPSSVLVDFDHGMNNAIARVREALSDTATTPRFIETIPRVGYRFLDAVVLLPQTADAATPPASSPSTSAPPPANAAAVSARSSWTRHRGLMLIAAAASMATALAVLAPLRGGETDHSADKPRPASVATATPSALKVSLAEREESGVRERSTGNAEAWRLYWIARGHLEGISVTLDLPLALRLFNEAILLDPQFAAAHAGVAEVHHAHAWSTGETIEASLQLGTAAAERAVKLDSSSSDVLKARGMLRYLRYRFAGDYAAYVAARGDFRRAVEIDPSNRNAWWEYGRAMFWHDPASAASAFEQAIQADPLAPGARNMTLAGLANRGQFDEARALCPDMAVRPQHSFGCEVPLATVKAHFGLYADALRHFGKTSAFGGGHDRIHLWAIHMSLGDRAAAQQLAKSGGTPFIQTLFGAALLCADGRHEQALAVLERDRGKFLQSRLLDLPTAKLALIAGRPKQALSILEQRLPDLVRGIEPITAGNVLPALDLATALSLTGARDEARALLSNIAAYLDGPTAVRLPMFTFQRARAHALAGESEAALRALDRAYAEGLRTLWTLDLRPQPLFYIDPVDADPAFNSLRQDLRYQNWLSRIRADNARQLEQIRSESGTNKSG